MAPALCTRSAQQPRDAAAQVLIDGVAVGRLDRNGPHNLTLDATAARAAAVNAAGGFAVLDVIVEAVGRSNQVGAASGRLNNHSSLQRQL
jgi:hypothetical protein